MMRFLRAVPGAALALLLAGGVALGSDDGTGGPEMATPNPEGCTRELVTAEVFEQFEQSDGGMFSGSIDSVDLAELDARSDADAETVQAIDETLRSYGSCIARYGPIGAYAFLNPDISLVEMVFLGVSGVTLADATPLAEGEAGTVIPASKLTPERVVELDEERIGALLPALQPGADFTLVTFVETDDGWMIEAINPVVEGGGDTSTGGGGP
jgi:hypothetical protein